MYTTIQRIAPFISYRYVRALLCPMVQVGYFSRGRCTSDLHLPLVVYPIHVADGSHSCLLSVSTTPWFIIAPSPVYNIAYRNVGYIIHDRTLSSFKSLVHCPSLIGQVWPLCSETSHLSQKHAFLYVTCLLLDWPYMYKAASVGVVLATAELGSSITHILSIGSGPGLLVCCPISAKCSLLPP